MLHLIGNKLSLHLFCLFKHGVTFASVMQVTLVVLTPLICYVMVIGSILTILPSILFGII